MPLPNVFGEKKNDSLFIAIFLSESNLRSVLWQVSEGEIQILEKSPNRAYTSLDNLLVVADQSLQALGPESEKTDQVVFCLPSSWANHEVAESKKPILKRISSELSLKAVGYVVSSEVMAQALFTDSQVISSMLLNVGESELEVMLVEHGKILLRQSVGRSNDLSADFTEALARIEQGAQRTYPARIILFSTELGDSKLSEAQQKILREDWRAKHNFVQVPMVETLKAAEVLRIIISQGGAAVANAQLPMTNAQSIIKSQMSNFKSQGFGFQEIQPQNGLADDNLRVPTSFGIPIEQNPKSLPRRQAGQIPNPKLKSQNSKLTNKNYGGSLIAKIIGNFKLPSHRQTLATEISHHKLIGFGFLAGLLTLLGIGFFFLASFSKLTVLITPESKTVAKELTVTLDPEANSVDAIAGVLPAQEISLEQSGSRTAASTGIKLIGDSAKGQVEILNKTDSEKTFASGTTLSANGLEFSLDSEVTVAAATIETTDDGETKIYGKAEAQVTAGEIGAESNLSAGVELNIADFAGSTYSVKVLTGLTGGSSREIQVVSEKDQAEILAELQKELVTSAQKEFEKQSGQGQFFAPTGEVDVLSAKYSAVVGDEVETLSLDLNIGATALTYKAEDLVPLAEETLTAELPEGYKLVGDPEILSAPGEVSDNGSVVLAANLSSRAQAELNEAEVFAQISGLSLSQALDLLTQKSEIKAVEYNFQPIFAKFLVNKIPRKTARVEVVISAN